MTDPLVEELRKRSAAANASALDPHGSKTACYMSGRADAYREAADELQAAVDAGLSPQWQPINTAPKDGSWVLLFTPSTECPPGAIHRGYLSSAGWRGEMWQLTQVPTHWMPLPAAPASSEAQP